MSGFLVTAGREHCVGHPACYECRAFNIMLTKVSPLPDSLSVSQINRYTSDEYLDVNI